MMLPTHALGGMLLALPLGLLAPESAPVVLLAGAVGGALPDADMYAGHRRTLHFPVYGSLAAVAAVGLAVTVPTAMTVAVAALLVGLAAHSVTDAFGGGLELRPWEGTADRAVYDHYGDRWLAPRRWVRYDGAPEDLLLAGLSAASLVPVVDGPLRWLVAALLIVGAVYTAVRRRLPSVAVSIVRRLPATLHRYVPARYTAGIGPDGG